jgi:hypothetical protein
VKNLGNISSEVIVIDKWSEIKYIEQNIINIGRDAVIVYIIK